MKMNDFFKFMSWALCFIVYYSFFRSFQQMADYLRNGNKDNHDNKSDKDSDKPEINK